MINFTRSYFEKLSKEKGYKFIKADTTRNYITGDGEHLLQDEGNICLKYFIGQVDKMK